MEKIDILVRAEKGAKLPMYSSEHAAGADIYAFLNQTVTLVPGERKAVSTGIYLELPEGYEAQVRPRSGLALKKGVTVLNSPGTIDADYRGELKVIIINLGKEDFVIKHMDRIAQLIISPVTKGNFTKTSRLSISKRGAGGFGSTGQ